ncbi:MAG: ParB/RepB/Spo0J family partition protein [Paracoccaceae bacterium]
MQTIPLNKLEPDPENVRRAQPAPGDIEGLGASIAAHGLLQNLVVRRKPGTKTKFLVTAGARRLAALRHLAEDGQIAQDHGVPCRVLAPEDGAVEPSLAENTCRAEMAPVDAFEAFAALRDQGAVPEEIAQRFGITEAIVLKRLRLGDLALEIREAMRAGHVSLEAAMAFARRPDPDLQRAVWQKLGGAPDTPFRANAWSIRRDMDEGGVPSSARRAQFVGVEVYIAAGGAFDRDLFDDEGAGVFADAALLDRLAHEKLEAAAEQSRAEGWAWVEVTPELGWEMTQALGRLYPEPVPNADADREEAELIASMAELEDAANAKDRAFTEDEEQAYEAASIRLDEIEEAREERFTPEQIASAGVFVTIGHAGSLRIEAGFVRKGDGQDTEGSNVAGNGEVDASVEDGAQSGPKPFSAALLTDLAKARNTVFQAHLAGDPVAAFDLLVFSLATRLLMSGHQSHGLSLSVHAECLPGSDDTPAAAAFLAARDGLALDWTRAGDGAACFEAFTALAFEDREAVMAWCVAALAMPRLAQGAEKTPDRHPLEQTGARMGVDIRTLWTPTTGTLFGRLSKGQILPILATCGGEAFAERHASMKKADLLTVTDRFFAGDARHLSAEAEAAAAAWLPEGMAYAAAAPDDAAGHDADITDATEADDTVEEPDAAAA